MNKADPQLPFVTVVMPVYNAGILLREAIESILRQTYTHFELLIINDGSKDDSAKIIESYTDARIRFVQNEQNLGLIATLNKALQLANGIYIARMDQDDISDPERIAKQCAALENDPELLGVGTAMTLLSATGQSVGYLPVLVNPETIKRALTVTNPFAHPSMLFRRDAARAAGGYNKDAYATEDYDLWIRLCAMGKVSNLDEPLLSYRLNPQGMSISLRSSQKKNAEKIADAAWDLYGEPGPAPISDWNLLWPQRQRSTYTSEQLLLYSTLHLLFAKGYRRRGKWGFSARHLVASLQWRISNRGSYVALLMFVMPYSRYRLVEERMAIMLNNFRAGQTA